MMRAKGSFDFLRRECVVGTALSVDRTYLGGQFACGEGVQLDCGLWVSSSTVTRRSEGSSGTHIGREDDGGRR